MSVFNGKWKLVTSENVEAFSKSIGVADDWIQSRKALDDPANNLIDELTITADSVDLVVHMGGEEKRRESVALNKEVDQPGLDGRPSKMKIVIDGNKITRTQVGDGFTATYVRTVNGNNMELVMTSSAGVTAKRTFTKV